MGWFKLNGGGSTPLNPVNPIITLITIFNDPNLISPKIVIPPENGEDNFIQEVSINVSYTDVNNNIINDVIITTIIGFSKSYEIKYGTNINLSVNNNYYFFSTNTTNKTLTNNQTNQTFHITIEKQSGNTLTFINDDFGSTPFSLTNNFGETFSITPQGTYSYNVPINTLTSFSSTNGDFFQITNSNPEINPNWVNASRTAVDTFTISENTTIRFTTNF